MSELLVSARSLISAKRDQWCRLDPNLPQHTSIADGFRWLSWSRSFLGLDCGLELSHINDERHRQRLAFFDHNVLCLRRGSLQQDHRHPWRNSQRVPIPVVFGESAGSNRPLRNNQSHGLCDARGRNDRVLL